MKRKTNVVQQNRTYTSSVTPLLTSNSHFLARLLSYEPEKEAASVYAELRGPRARLLHHGVDAAAGLCLASARGTESKGGAAVGA